MATSELPLANNLNNANLNREKGDLGFEAEDAVVEFFAKNYPNMSIRHATPEEDRGFDGVNTGKTIDAVVYSKPGNTEPALGLQITTATDSVVRLKKMTELKDHPFLRLNEMKPSDPPIPRVLVFVEAGEVDKYMRTRDFSQSEKLSLQIIESIINSLKFDSLRTHSTKEKASLAVMIETWQKEADSLKKKNSKPN